MAQGIRLTLSRMWDTINIKATEAASSIIYAFSSGRGRTLGNGSAIVKTFAHTNLDPDGKPPFSQGNIIGVQIYLNAAIATMSADKADLLSKDVVFRIKKGTDNLVEIPIWMLPEIASIKSDTATSTTGHVLNIQKYLGINPIEVDFVGKGGSISTEIAIGATALAMTGAVRMTQILLLSPKTVDRTRKGTAITA